MKKNKFGDIAITSSISGHQAIHGNQSIVPPNMQFNHLHMV